MASWSVRFGVQSWRLSNIEQSLDSVQKLIISSSSMLRKARLAVGPNSICSRYHPPTRTGHAWWIMARSPYVFHKEDLCPSSGDINRLMMNVQKQQN
jgi:hypothetical protein